MQVLKKIRYSNKEILRRQHWSSLSCHIPWRQRIFIAEARYVLVSKTSLTRYEGESISNQPFPFPISQDGHDFHVLFQYMFYMWVQKCTLFKLFFNNNLPNMASDANACFSSKVEYRTVIRYLY